MTLPLDRQNVDNMTVMNINEAIEVMKILAPYKDILNQPNKKMAEILQPFFKKLEEDEMQEQALRLVALMYHVDIQEVYNYLKDRPSFDLTRMLVDGFIVNNLTALLDAVNLLKVGEA